MTTDIIVSQKTGRYNLPCTDKFLEKKDKKEKIVQSKKWSAITMTSTVWKPGQKGNITITFGNYNCSGCSPDAAWSQIGSNSNSAYPSMNLGFIDPPYNSFEFDGVVYNVPDKEERNYCGTTGPSSCDNNWVAGATVVHEFCHALGMMHEHQNNLNDSNPIHLNREGVIDYYNKIGMGESGAIINVLDTYECSGSNCEYDGTSFDPESIMMYALPDNWIAEGYTNPTKPNFVLSDNDKNWLREIYPLDSNNYPEITVKFIDGIQEPWKIAWVIKSVKKAFENVIGIKWIFIHDLESKVDDNSEITLDPRKRDTMAGNDNIFDNVELNTGEIVGIVFGGIAILILFLVFLHFMGVIEYLKQIFTK